MSLLTHETLFRIGFSLGGLVLFWSLALVFPFRKATEFSNLKRISSNLIFSFGNGALLKLILPFGLVYFSKNTFLGFSGLMNLGQFPLGSLIGFLILDCAIYWQHRLTHHIPILWRLHRVHHCDLEIDTSTAGRFHFMEIFLSFFYKAFFIILFSIPTSAIIVFEITLNFAASFNHSNFQLPAGIEKPLRWLLITPDTHRIHHSVYPNETNSNFGFSVSLWDRLFGSYCDKSKEDQQNMNIGLKEFRNKKDQSFFALLRNPFLKH